MKVVVAAAAIALLAGCASQPQTKDAAPVSSAASKPVPQKTTDLWLAKGRLGAVEPAVYFDYDKFNIKPQFHNTVSAFGNYLALDDKARIVIEGNADERGTVEYNLALGQKRAEAVSIGLQAIGANPARIEAISNGEEKPRNKAKTEAAFAENRRADLIVK
ncbi:OmpA Outer membrane protein and related peptidoglycan-associated (lipo)proteins [Burkholderiales bacterium]